MAARKKMMDKTESLETVTDILEGQIPNTGAENLAGSSLDLETDVPETSLPEAKPEAPDKISTNTDSDAIKKWHITAPTAFSGNIGGVEFTRGEADTDSSWMATWFRNKGYRVEMLKEG